MDQASKENHYHYNSSLRSLAKELRSKSTFAEKKLWKASLSKGKMRGFTFKRQRPVLNYIADFMCTELLLIIELDGISHLFHRDVKSDTERKQDLEAIGFTVLNFTDKDVVNNLSAVDEAITGTIEELERKLNSNGTPPL